MNSLELYIRCEYCRREMGVMLLFFSSQQLGFDTVHVCADCTRQMDELDEQFDQQFENIIKDL